MNQQQLALKNAVEKATLTEDGSCINMEFDQGERSQLSMQQLQAIAYGNDTQIRPNGSALQSRLAHHTCQAIQEAPAKAKSK